MDHWTETIQALEERAVELDGFAKKARLAAQALREIKAHREARGEPGPQTPTAGQKRIQKPAATKSPKGRQSKLTHYKGVRLGKPLCDGTPRYEVNVWDGDHVKYLGGFSIEEEAAAVAAEARGEKAEAGRLRELVKQKVADEQDQSENNPSQPPTRKAQKAKEESDDDSPPEAGPGHVDNVWSCDKCGHQHLITKRPDRCEECGHGLLSKFV